MLNDGAVFLFHKDVQFYLDKDSRIEVLSGTSSVGYQLPGFDPRPSYNNSIVILKRGARLILGANVRIAAGTYIYVGENARLTMHGGNWLGHNCSIICTQQMELFENASMSWNVSVIDDDGRVFFDDAGKPILKRKSNLVLKKNSGLQMNVVIPKGVVVGENSVVGANTVIRQDVPDNCLAYQNPELKLKSNTTLGWQYGKTTTSKS